MFSSFFTIFILVSRVTQIFLKQNLVYEFFHMTVPTNLLHFFCSISYRMWLPKWKIQMQLWWKYNPTRTFKRNLNFLYFRSEMKIYNWALNTLWLNKRQAEAACYNGKHKHKSMKRLLNSKGTKSQQNTHTYKWTKINKNTHRQKTEAK